MNRLELKGSWNLFKGHLDQWCGRIVHNPRLCERGHSLELIGLIQKRNGAALREAKRFIRTYRLK